MTLASEGDIVTCENGHRLYRITKDILQGTTLSASQFETIHDSLDDPLPMSLIKPECPDCGRPWMKHRRSFFGFVVGHLRIHFEDGWRPPDAAK